MTILDASIQLDSEDEPAENAEFVLDVVDGMDSFGFIEHLKLPHYVTFQSILDRIRGIRERKGAGGAGAEEPGSNADASGDESDGPTERDETEPAAMEAGDDD
jgi:alpha-D-ribose 1-methylphosphonate 5-triphosphate synthase subunit PhnI